MTFFAIGLNHLRAPVRVREHFALDASDVRRLLQALRLGPDSELILLSTCNRTEAYLYGTEDDADAVRAALAERAGTPWPEDVAFELRSESAVRHVLQVTAGLRSLVLGDAQIFAQVKEAYRLGVEEDRVGPAMHRLMHTAFRTAKRVINETALSSGAASVPRVAVAAARTFVERHGAASLGERSLLIVGAGEMGRQTLEALRDDERKNVAVTNRSPERARRLAATFGLRVVPWEERYDAIAAADVVIVATGADEPVVRARDLVTDPQTTRLFVDISVPRNVEREVDGLPGCEVLDLDTLNLWLVQTEQVRRAAVPAAERICDEMIAEFMTWAFHHRAMQPAIDAIRDTFERIRAQEVERHHHRFSELDKQELDRLTSSIIQKVLAVPVVRLKSVDPDSIDFIHGIRLLHALFSRPGCEDPAAEGAARESLKAVLSLASPAACPFEEKGAEAPCRARSGADVQDARPALPGRQAGANG